MRRRAIVILTILTLQGCAQPQGAPAIPEPDQKATSPVIAAKKTSSMQVAILASENIPAYSNVAMALAKQLGRRGNIYYLSDSQLENLKTIAKFKNEDRIQVVSIGLNASIAAKALTNRQVVFCQVFNHQDYSLITPMHKGVSMLPSLPKTFNAWRALSPATTDIGIISGPGFDDLIQTAKAAAKAYGFTLHHITVSSDKEYQYAYKNLSKKVQGYWLLPDNRVLSENILRDIMTFSVRNSKQVAVFSDELLKLGGLFSIGSDYQDIARHVFDRLEQALSAEAIPGPDIVYLEKLNLRINPAMAKNLGLKIPAQYRKVADAQ